MLKRLFYQLLGLKDHPVLYHSRDFYLVGFGFFAAIATFFGLIIFTWFAYTNGLVFKTHLSIWLTLVLFLMIVFAKFLHPFVVGRDFFKSPMKYLRQTAFYNQGGQIGVFLSFVIIAFFEGIDFLLLLDGACYAFSCALIFGRIGCYNYGCCYGKITKSPYAVRYTNPETKVLRIHPELRNKKLIPVQLIQAMFNLLLFIVLTALLFTQPKAGVLAFTFIIAYNGFRMIVHPLRMDDFEGGSKPNALYLYISVFFACIGLIVLTYFSIYYNTIHNLVIQNPFDIVSYVRNYLGITNMITIFCISFAVFWIYGYHKNLGKHF